MCDVATHRYAKYGRLLPFMEKKPSPSVVPANEEKDFAEARSRVFLLLFYFQKNFFLFFLSIRRVCRSIILHLFQSSSVGFGDGIFVDYCCCYYSQRSNSSSFRRESQAKKMVVLLPPACRQKKKKTAELSSSSFEK